MHPFVYVYYSWLKIKSKWCVRFLTALSPLFPGLCQIYLYILYLFIEQFPCLDADCLFLFFFGSVSESLLLLFIFKTEKAQIQKLTRRRSLKKCCYTVGTCSHLVNYFHFLCKMLLLTQGQGQKQGMGRSPLPWLQWAITLWQLILQM